MMMSKFAVVAVMAMALSGVAVEAYPAHIEALNEGTHFEHFTNWLNTNDYQGFLGEFGAPDQLTCLKGLKQMVDIIEQNPKAWIGWAYWASGEWWPKNSPMIIQPDLRNGGKAQLTTLQPVLNEPDTRLACNAH